jgi:Transposase DDE domain group 1
LRELRGRVGRDCPSPKFHPPTWRLSETLGWQCVVDQTALPAWRRRVSHRAVVRFYNQRGTAERWIKEGKTATHWTRLSCHRFRANEVRLLLGVIAYNLGNLLRRLVLPVAIQDWSLTSLQQRLLKTGGRLIRHARYFTLQLAESYLTGALFRQILQRIERLGWHPT